MREKRNSFWRIFFLLVVGLSLLLISMGVGILVGQIWPGDEGETAVSSPPTPTAPIENPAALSTIPPSITPTIAPTEPKPADTIMPTMTFPPTLTPSPIPSATPSPSPTAFWVSRQVLGYSLQERPIELVQIGQGENWFILLGALHGGLECNTTGVVEGIIEYFVANPQDLPPDVTLFAIPRINQDGCAANTRSNANNVDLNRNWDTPDWQADAEASAGIIPGSGGEFPFSEPETQLLRDWLLAQQLQAPNGQLVVVSYHSAVPRTGLAQPGYIQPGQPGFTSNQFALEYSNTTGYLYSATWVGNYTITGEFIHWANLQNIVALDVELPDREAANTIPAGWSETHIQTNIRGVLAIINGEGVQ